MVDVEHIKQLRAQRAHAAETVDALDTAIAHAITEALAEGYSPTKLAKDLGITRARIYQIRDSRR